jgi:two-component system CheB/CheR fusion protein
MGSTLQKKLIPLFHYALNPGGALFLGTSETTGDFSSLFSVMDGKQKIYLRKEDFIGARRAIIDQFVPILTAVNASLPSRGAEKTFHSNKPPLRELTESELLQQVIAAGALVNGQGDILYLHGRTGMFLEPAPGEAGINNILKMAREGLRNDLAMALHKAAGTKGTVCHPGLRVKTNGHFTTVNLTVRPVTTGAGASLASPLYLVILEEAGEPGQVPVVTEPAGSDKLPVDVRIEALKAELRAKEEYLQSANEELQSSNEELKSSNEELQSVNEEMQSTNEELETSKEELQSLNEELSTVNAELQVKMLDLTRANNDMNNLLSGTGIATVFLDHQLRILRFTPTASEIINLIPIDAGRPVAHIVSNLVAYDRLVADAQSVLDTLIPKEVEVQTLAGKWYTLRILPYRTLANVIEGAVMTFVDITEIVKTREALKSANDQIRLAVILRDAHDAITVQDLEGRTIAWNPGAVKLYGWSEAEALAMNVRDRIPKGLRAGALTTLIQLSRAEVLAPYQTQRMTKSGAIVEVSIISTALVNEAGTMYAVATTERKSEAANG